MFFCARSITASRSCELLQILGGALLGLLQRIAEPVRNRIEPLVDRVLELRLAVGQHA